MKKTWIFALVIACAVTFVYSCSNPQEHNEADDITDPPDIIEDGVADDTDETDVMQQPEKVDISYTITYYDVIADEMIEFSATETFDEKANPEFFIDKLSELMQVRITINSIDITEDKMIIDFSSDSAPLKGTGAYEESCILDSISNVMIDVFADINKIYFTSDGKDYESGHLSLSAETPYEERRSENY